MIEHISREANSHVYTVELAAIDGEPPSHVVITSIAALTDRDPLELDPLSDSIDPEALDDIVDTHRNPTGTCRVSFQYEGYAIDVIGDRELQITPLEKTPSASV